MEELIVHKEPNLLDNFFDVSAMLVSSSRGDIVSRCSYMSSAFVVVCVCVGGGGGGRMAVITAMPHIYFIICILHTA